MAASLERQIGNPSREATALDCAGDVLQVMDNPEDAAAFHLQAARMHQQLGDGWQQALATVHVAECEAALGRDAASREHLALALELTHPFSDGRAMRLRHSLKMRLA